MPAHIIPNISGSVEKHLMGYSNLLTKPQYKHFKKSIVGIAEGASSLADLSRQSGTSERTLWHFFNESFFDDTSLLKKSASVMNNHTETRSKGSSFLILDYTSVFKTGKGFEWSDWLWNEETDEADKVGHEQAIALEYDPEKDYRKCLGYRRFYHDEVLYQTEYWRDDFEKKPVVASRLLKETKPLTKTQEVLVDGEFINCFLVNRFEQLSFVWTGRMRKSLIVTHDGKTMALEQLAAKLIKEKAVAWKKAQYRNQKIMTFGITVSISSLADRKVRIAVCKNKKGQLAFIGTSLLNRESSDIIKVYSYRWEIEVFFKDMKQNLSFGDYRMRRVGANSRWQIFTLITANLIELVRKTKLEKMAISPNYSWFKEVVKKMYSATRITLGITIKILKDLRSGGRELIASLKSILHLNKAKFYLYNGVNLARL